MKGAWAGFHNSLLNAHTKKHQQKAPDSHGRKIVAITTEVLEWFFTNARELPWRRTSNPYAIWVSEIMLQQTQVKTVVRYWERWMRALPTVEALARARPSRIHKLWEGLGYYTRGRNMQRAARLMVEKHEGKVPQTCQELLELPGIGRYTAGAICSIAYNQPEAILDGNIVRVLARVFAIEGSPRERSTNERLWALAGELVTEPSRTGTRRKRSNSCSQLNQGLMELGAVICSPRQPDCAGCPLKSLCAAFQQQRVHELPRLGPRPAITPRRFLGFIIERNGSLLLRQRPAKVVNAHLWEFPNVEVNGTARTPMQVARALFGPAVDKVTPVCSIKHSITRYRMTLDMLKVSAGSGDELAGVNGMQWVRRTAVKRLAFCSAHRRVLQALKVQWD